MKIRDVFHLIDTDIARYADENGMRLSFWKKLSILLLPCILCVAIYRFSHFFYVNHHPVLARIFWTLNIFLFSADITPYSEIGSYLSMPHCNGIVIAGKIGSHATVYARVGIGHSRKGKGVDLGKDSPVIGDHVVIGANSFILGPVTVGNHATIGPCSLVVKNVPENTVVFGSPAKVIKKKQASSQESGDDVFSE